MKKNNISARKPSGFRLLLAVWIGLAAVMSTPGQLHPEVLYLKDGSAIRGSVVGLVGDTLTFDPSFGGRMRIARSLIAGIVFSETATSLPSLTGERAPDRSAAAEADERGYVAVSFKDRGVSSKVVVENKADEAHLLRANWIVQALIVDGDTVFSDVDTTMDKTIYKGHVRLYKNDTELKDIKVPLEPGVHHCVVVAASNGGGWENVEFEKGPLDLGLNLDNVQVFPGRVTRVEVGMKKGRFRLGKPEFYQVR